MKKVSWTVYNDMLNFLRCGKQNDINSFIVDNYNTPNKQSVFLACDEINNLILQPTGN